MKTRAVFALCAIIVALVATLFVFQTFDSSTESQARAIVKTCAAEKDYAFCYEREIPELFPSLAIPDIFNIVRMVRRLDPEYKFCHVLGHRLGERVVAEDPSKWFEMLSLNPPDNLCSSGFLHGVAVARFRSEVLDDDGLKKLVDARACEARSDWVPTPFEQATCYHGLGHLLFFVTDAHIPKALSLCLIAADNPNQHRLCREGVFMTVYQPLEPDDFLMVERMPIKPSTTTVRSYCARFAEDGDEGACLRESWPYSREGIFDGSGIGEFCSDQPNMTEEHSCYESVFSIVGRLTLGTTDGALEICAKVPILWREMCYDRAALASVEEDAYAGKAAVAFCMRTPGGYQTRCLLFLAERADFVFGERPGRETLCDALPSRYLGICEPAS